MEEMKNVPPKPVTPPPVPPYPVKPEQFPTGSRELRFAGVTAVLSVFLANVLLMGGFRLGFALAAVGCILCATIYLLRSGKRLTGYTGTLLALSLVIAVSFLRSDDGFVKFVMVCFLLVSVNLGLCLLAGQNLRGAEGIASLLDAPRALFSLGFGKIEPAIRGLNTALRQMETAGKKRGAVLLGLLVAIPVLAIVIPLLMSADAAFEGLLSKLPAIEWGEIIGSVFLGLMLACVLYTRGTALLHSKKPDYVPKQRKGLSSLTLNTVLGAVGLVYVVYLISQLAYFVGGFAGILPEGYTMAQYARRGFFEMAWLCAINLAVMTLAVGLVEKKDGRAPLSTRLLCLFVGLVTLFFVATASAKMFLYIGAYGLTRLRVLTEVIMVFLALTTVTVSLWLFLPKMPYMKIILIIALVMGAATSWADVDAVVAAYNVEAYRSGALQTVDMDYLASLGCGAVPSIEKLLDSPDEAVAKQARRILTDCANSLSCRQDLRSWNISAALAWETCKEYAQPEVAVDWQP
ncbi:MAG: DUF4153 domain-containing protein [Faecousia sp.]